MWDVAPGYLNRQSLLGEHRELHGLHSILVHGKTGYSRHPETLRWVRCETGLVHRHALLAAEMRLRGYCDRTPLRRSSGVTEWPTQFITPPWRQYAVLRAKYRHRERGRIGLPRSAQDLWAQHKYSVLARDPTLYRSIGRRTSAMRGGSSIAALAAELTLILRTSPSSGTLMNALEHMWGYVSRQAAPAERRRARTSPSHLLVLTAELAKRWNVRYLMASTALSELAVYADYGFAADARDA